MRPSSNAGAANNGGNGNRSNNGTGKMRIRAFPMSMDENYVQKLWEMLRNAITEIQKKNNSGLSFEELYRNAYTMVLHKHGDRLYNGAAQVVQAHLKDKVRPEVDRAVLSGDFLVVLNSAYTEHHTAMIMIRDILMYMDRVYVAQQQVDPVYSMGMRLFRDNITHHNNIQHQLTTTLLNMIHRERTGEAIDRYAHALTVHTALRSAISTACKMLVNLGNGSLDTYESDFERPFLAQTAEFYKIESQTFLAENSANEYVRRVEQRLVEESARAKLCMDRATEPKVIRVLEDQLISAHMKAVVDMENSGLVSMLMQRRLTDLQSLYNLVRRVPDGVATMCTCLSAHLRKEGAKLTADNATEASAAAGDQPCSSQSTSVRAQLNPVQYIESLLALKAQYEFYLRNAFGNDAIIKRAVQTDFEKFINDNPRSAEFMSLFIDDVLKNSTKRDDAEVEAQLDKVMVLFRYLEEKDLFERYYKQHLAKRLLQNKNNSDDIEKLMITKLKTECGCQFTSKLEGMFKDMLTTSTLNEKWRQEFNNFSESDKRVELDVKVLTAGCWPTQTAQACELPPDMNRIWDKYIKFYVHKHSGRKIQLVPTMGGGEIIAYFYGVPGGGEPSSTRAVRDSEQSEQMDAPPTPASARMLAEPRRHILQLSTPQMIVLQLFAPGDRLTCQKIQEKTQLSEKDVARTLQSLAMGKAGTRVLCRRAANSANSKEIENADEFWFNEHFTSKLHRVKIPMVSGKADTEPETRLTREKVSEDRRYEIEASIVRVMKARKKLQINQLITEVTEQLSRRFPPNPTQIKARIETLIEREYLKRDDADQRVFHYVA